MLTQSLFEYMPHVGLFLILLGMIFGLVSFINVKSLNFKTATPSDVSEEVSSAIVAQKYEILSNVCLVSGAALLIGGQLNK
jgi:hypothetical protein